MLVGDSPNKSVCYRGENQVPELLLQWGCVYVCVSEFLTRLLPAAVVSRPPTCLSSDSPPWSDLQIQMGQGHIDSSSSLLAETFLILRLIAHVYSISNPSPCVVVLDILVSWLDIAARLRHCT